MRREEKIVEGRKTGIDFLSYENYNEDVDYAGKHKMTVTEVVLQGLERILNRPE